MFEYRHKSPIPDTTECYWQPVLSWAFEVPLIFSFIEFEYRVDGKIYTEESKEFFALLSWYAVKYV